MTDTATFDTILLDVAGALATITLNRPDQLNAMPPAMADDMRAALDHLPGLGARALLITGAGRGFCSGADLGDVGQGGGASAGANSRRALRTSYNPLMLALARLDIPVVAAVNGPAAGIGCSLALAADFVVAADTAYFLQAFANIGLVPDGGASWTLPRLIGLPRAMQMMMLGERISAAQAADWGMIYRVVPEAALLDEARALALRLAGGPTLALGQMRRTVRAGLDQDFAATLDAEAMAQGIAGDSADAREGIIAFLQKRPAQFSGK